MPESEFRGASTIADCRINSTDSRSPRVGATFRRVGASSGLSSGKSGRNESAGRHTVRWECKVAILLCSLLTAGMDDRTGCRAVRVRKRASRCG
jgi:hypothetical protein